MRLAIGELAKLIGSELSGADGISDIYIRNIGAVESCGEEEITFISNPKHIAKLKNSCAAAVIVSSPVAGFGKPQLIVENVDAALIKVLNIFAPELTPAKAGIDPSAQVAEGVKLGKGACICANAVIDGNVEIGENSIIGAGCKVGENSVVGSWCRIDANVVIHHNCRIGNHVIIQSNSVIGSTGFGYSFIEGSHRLIPHNGGVIIEDHVEIGANCCVDRAKFGNTIVGAGTKTDNFVQIAHNAVVGKCCLFVAHVAVGGSAKIGNGVVLAGKVGVGEGLEIGDRVIATARSGLTHNVEAGQVVTGMPAYDRFRANRVMAATRRLPEMLKELKQLIVRVDKLGAAKDNKK